MKAYKLDQLQKCSKHQNKATCGWYDTDNADIVNILNDETRISTINF